MLSESRNRVIEPSLGEAQAELARRLSYQGNDEVRERQNKLRAHLVARMERSGNAGLPRLD